MLRFSGHDTFHCREQWLLKGVQLIENENDMNIFREESTISRLGVGKNMVRSIQHWLKSFDIIHQESNELSELAKLLFTDLKLDPYLENEGSLWLLQYYLCRNEYASIFKCIFLDYFSEKATLEFSESQVVRFLNRVLNENNQRSVSENTLTSDYKVFIKTYVAPQKNFKTVEDDFNVPLLGLNLIIDTGRRNGYGENIYRINKSEQETLSIDIFAFIVLKEFQNQHSVNFDEIRKTLGSILCLSTEGLENIINELCSNYSEFVYKDDAGVRQLQIKHVNEDFKINVLKRNYEKNS